MEINENKLSAWLMILSLIVTIIWFIANLDKRLAIHEQIDNQQSQQIDQLLKGKCHA